MAEKWKGALSKDLPGGRVEIKEPDAERKGYYKYYLETFYDITQEKKNLIRASVFPKGEGLELADRSRICEESAFPAKDGYYPLKGGGVVSVANVKTPDLTGEMLGWWASWHGLEHLRYAIWDPEDHYGIEVLEGKERLLDESIPAAERVWGTHHKIWESMDADPPGQVEMYFYSPWECGFDRSLEGTDRNLYTVCAQGYIGGVPAFATEMLVKGEDGQNEIRCRFWVGYERQKDGTFKYKLPFFIKPPKKIVANLIIHNHREFSRLNQVLPRIYEEYKDKPFDAD